jgi:hypothetical protein
VGERGVPVTTEATKMVQMFKYKRDAKVGDVVLRKGKTAASQTYKYARITRVHIGSDGKMRAADIEYKVPGESKFRSTTRPIHKLVLIVLVEELTMEEDEGPSDQEERECIDQSPETKERNEEEHDKVECEEQCKGGPRKPENEERRPAEAKANGGAGCEVQEEETASEAKKEAIPMAPDIQYSDGIDAIMDVGKAVKKSRGRPRKPEIAGGRGQEEPVPPGPSKGSVTDKGTKRCVDPRGNEAILNVGGGEGPGPPGGEERMNSWHQTVEEVRRSQNVGRHGGERARHDTKTPRRINHMAVKNHLHSSSGIREVVSGTETLLQFLVDINF